MILMQHDGKRIEVRMHELLSDNSWTDVTFRFFHAEKMQKEYIQEFGQDVYYVDDIDDCVSKIKKWKSSSPYNRLAFVGDDTYILHWKPFNF